MKISEKIQKEYVRFANQEGTDAIQTAFWGEPTVIHALENIIHMMNSVAEYYCGHSFLSCVRVQGDTLKNMAVSIGWGNWKEGTDKEYYATYDIAADTLHIEDFDENDKQDTYEKTIRGLYAAYLAVISEEHTKFRKYIEGKEDFRIGLLL